MSARSDDVQHTGEALLTPQLLLASRSCLSATRGLRLAGTALILLEGVVMPAAAQPTFGQSTAPVALSAARPVQARTSNPTIEVGRVILAEPKAETPLAIQVGPLDALPRTSFLRIRGLPPMAALSEGHAIAPGAWAVPLVALPSLRINLPETATGRSEVILTLVTVDGVVLTESRTTLVIANATTLGGSEPKSAPPTIATISPAPPKPIPVPAPPASAKQAAPPAAASPEDQARAQRYLNLGHQKLGDGDVAAAQLFYQRAADAGSADGALALAGTYDPIELERTGLRLVQGDAAKARQWYERAHALGAAAAAQRLQRLGTR